MATKQITPDVWCAVMREHDEYWAKLQPDLRRYMLAYECSYWDRSNLRRQDLVIETSRGYEFVEGYIASLFSKNPAVVTKPDPRGNGNARVVQGLSNQFLGRVRTIVEDASRLALIYPNACIKLSPVENNDVYKRVTAAAVPGWDVIVDKDAESWSTQRFVGHRYWLPVAEAEARYGKKDYTAVEKVDYLAPAAKDRKSRKLSQGKKLFDFVEVVEVYDLLDDRLLIWSQHYKNGREWLDDGKEIEVEGVTTKFDAIPFRGADKHPLVPLIPLYFTRKPDSPLRGISSMKRVYDQIQEVNIARTYQAAEVRKCARQFLTRKGKIDGEGMAKITQGVDGEIIEVNLQPGETLADVMLPVPHTPARAEVVSYLGQVQDDLNRGSVLAPFTRGEATKASATEITALAAYSSSEIGRLARERDAAIEQMARTYTSMLRLYVDETGNDILLLDGKPQVVKPDDLDGEFLFYAQDGGNTPVSEAQKKAELTNAIPLLLQLGVPKEQILSEVVRQFNLPETFIPDTTAQKPAATSAVVPGGPTVPAGGDIPPDVQLGIGPGALPSPGRVSQVLP